MNDIVRDTSSDKSLELCVIGELYLDRENKHFDDIAESDFMQPKAREMYKMLKKYPEMRDDIAILIDKSKTEKINQTLVKGLFEALEHATAVSLVESHINELKEKTKRRKILTIAAKKEMLTSEEITELHDLTRPANTKRAIVERIDDISLRYMDELDTRKKIFSNGFPYPTGFRNIDDKTGGLQKHNIFVVGGRTSLGKTTFMINVALNMLAVRNVPTIYFTCEMEPIELMDRIVSIKTGIENQKIRYGRHDPNDMQRIQTLFTDDKFYTNNLRLFYSPQLSIDIIRRTLDEFKPEIIFVDHVQLLKTKGINRAMELENAMYELKEIANVYDVAIMSGSQISRESEKQKGRTELSNLYFKGSGGIEESATVASELRLAKDERRENDVWRIDFDISKNRFGGVGSVSLDFDRNKMKFREVYR